MAIAKFLLFTAIGCAVWVTAVASLGDALGSSYSHVLKDFKDVGYVAAVLAVLAVVVLFLHRLRTLRHERA